ncbi:SAV_2336 N-terminal domain-related protein [Streptomyces sp. TRM 70351]|uniref:SAV_2336 N-terminal domain-related protein n=1 Tax=Streptomyces sp. TRM 70351 TaxID=3116552 RepID=UPI002E7BB88E|nr:SAV_2336 N-terminal domain-related protein [Streptomyces sp. TRM 70351]MEE1927620.1 SAV_2336 N-terminal domain-related protein [Streptomyces sp. TRM 70351]
MFPPPHDRRLRELVARMHAAGLDPTAEEVADALWLARWTAPARDGAGEPRPAGHGDAPAAGEGGDGPRGSGAAGAGGAGRSSAPPGDGRAGDAGDRRPAEVSPPVSLYAPGGPAGGQRPPADGPAPGSGTGDAGPGARTPGAFPVRAPAAAALPGLLDLQRALHPLRGYRPRAASGRRGLDEDATADLSARAGTLRPVLRPVERGDIDMQLLLDASPSMVVWERMFEELRQVCEQIGVFRDVQAHYLHRDDDGTPLIGTAARGGAPMRLRAAGQFRDPTGRRLTLVVSDCVGPLWRAGTAQRLLHRWAGTSPVALVQPLPPRLWHRTALPAATGVLTRRPAGGPLGFRADGYGPGGRRGPGARPVPVLSPTAPALGTWARLLSGSGPGAARGAAVWLSADHPPVPGPGPHRTPRDPAELLRAFTAGASPGARRLAAHLAAAPTALPVMQLVQRALLPDTGPMELAEVLLGGLLWQVPGPAAAAAHGLGAGPHYRFADGVREILLESLGQDAAAMVLGHCSDLVAQHFGKGARNFPALAVARLTDASGGPSRTWRGAGGRAVADVDGTETAEAAESPESALFAEVPARVVRWFQPAPSGDDASGPVGKAESLLREWHQQRDPALLTEAAAYAEEAVTEAAEAARGAALAADPHDGAADGARALLVLGRVLLARAGTAAVRRDPTARAVALDRALAVLADAAARATPGSPWHARAALELAAAHYADWHARGGTRRLDAAEGVLRALDPGGLGPDERRTRHLRLGRVLLARASAEADIRTRSGAADEAADELRAACEQSEAAEVAAELRAGALLDLAAALRLRGGRAVEALGVLDRADALAGDAPALRERLLLTRARVLADAGRAPETDAAYDRVADLAPRDSLRRCEVLAEWGAHLLERAGNPAASPETVGRAEGVLREAFATVPGRHPLFVRLQLLLGRALLLRYRREGFPPDRYEGVHLLGQAARRGPDAELRAAAWLELGAAHLGEGDGGGPQDAAARGAPLAEAASAYRAALEEARRAAGEGAPSVAAARALHGRGAVLDATGRSAAAQDAYRAAADEWRRLVAHLAPVPWDEVEATRLRVAGQPPQR